MMLSYAMLASSARDFSHAQHRAHHCYASPRYGGDGQGEGGLREYASESEVVRDGLRALKARDAALEAWLRDEAAKSYDEFVADRSIGIPAEDVMARVRSSYRKRLGKSEGE